MEIVSSVNKVLLSSYRIVATTNLTTHCCSKIFKKDVFLVRTTGLQENNAVMFSAVLLQAMDKNSPIKSCYVFTLVENPGKIVKRSLQDPITGSY